MPIKINTGVGRIVWGNPGKGQIKKHMDGPNKGNPVLNKENQPITQWAFGVAFPKQEFGPIWAAMSQEAATGFPNGTPAKFAWKYVDGDGIDHNGKPFNTREGYAGSYVLTVSTEAFAPPIYRFQNGVYIQLKPEEIKCGDFVALGLNIKLNIPSQSTHSPSLYINPEAIEFVGFGTEIQNGPDPMTVFGGVQRQLPPGASATPLAPSHGVGMPGTNGPGQMQPGGPQSGYQQATPGYAPPNDPRFTGGGPGANGMPQGGQQQPQMQPNGYPNPGHPNNGQSGPGQMQPNGYPPNVAPAHDFVHNAGQQQPGGYQQPNPNGGYVPPQQQPQYQPNPNGGYVPPQQQPGGYQPQYQPNPGQQQMPGMPPNR